MDSDVAQLAMDEPDALLEPSLLVLLGGDERALEVVEDRQELLHEPLVGPHDQGRLVAQHPLAVVVEVRGDPLEVVEVLIALALEELDALLQLCQRLLGLLRAGGLLGGHQDCFASSSMTS